MNIVFATLGLDFNGDTLKTASLGGSETALSSMAFEMAKRGHSVTVFCACSKPGIYDGVRYESADNYVQMCRNMTIDVLVISRFAQLWHPEIGGAINVYWLHDMPDDPGRIMAASLKADFVFTLSDFHSKAHAEAGTVLQQLERRTKNGVNMDWVQGVAAGKPVHPARFLYSSLPERGLERLLKNIWPNIKSRIPEAELVIAGYDLASVQSLIGDDMRKHQAEIIQMAARTPGVKLIGSLHKRQLYSLMKSCVAHLYPVTYPEIFCITAVEAQACGLPIITTNAFALPEVVGPSGILVEPNEEYDRAFADAAVQVHANKDIGEAAKVDGPAFVRDKGFIWSNIAREWDEMFAAEFNRRASEEKQKVATAMMWSGDTLQAKLLTEEALDIELPPRRVLSEVDHEAVGRLVYGIWKQIEKVGGKKVLDLQPGANLAAAIAMEDSTIEVHTTRQPGVEYDAVYIGEEPAFTAYPDACISRCQKYVKKGGWVFSATPSGRMAMTSSSGIQQWSLTSDDLRQMSRNIKQFAGYFGQLYVGSRGEKEGYWVSAFSAEGDVERLDMQARSKRFRPYRTLSVCMIAKNEEKWINMCLAEVKDIADEIIVVDTGSTDRTRELAASYGAKVIDAPFEDFSQARNVYMEAAKCDWILQIDCDERLVNPDRVRKYLDFAIANAYTIRQNHLIIDGEGGVDNPARMFRNKKSYRYVGAIHEHCEDTDVPEGSFSKSIQPAYAAADLDLAHYGYVHENHRRKKALVRNMDLLIKDAEVNLPKGRMLTWVLAMRDYLNAIKWNFRRLHQNLVEEDSFEHDLAESVIITYHAIFKLQQPDMERLAYGFYQEACKYLADSSLKFRPIGLVPFSTKILLDARRSTDANSTPCKPTDIWFIHGDELRAFLDWNQSMLVKQMHAESKRTVPNFTWELGLPAPDPVKLLKAIKEFYKRG